ncbi:MAG: molybdopterin-dependent oxidoreductase [Haliea sp.]|jgi:anaerobic selenocysteine-containing dehydrogenase|nr:molybdopterin-dependent oxidoreductase [Haliea sp.]
MNEKNSISECGPKLSRRKFLKQSGGVGIIAAVGGGPALSFFSMEAKASAPRIVEQWMSSTCQGCTAWCPVQVQVTDGRAIKLRGNPHSKATHGAICPRPHMALQQLYDPDRVKMPMKRTNPKKGRDQDPGFVPISWDEAMDMLADRMMDLRESGETYKFAVFRGRYSYMRDVIYSSLPKVFGSPNGISHSAICAEAEKFGAFFTEGYWDYRDYDLEHTRYVMCWGADPLASNRQVPHAISIWGHVRDRAQIAAIDPRLSATAAKADEWLPVVPGEDAALAVSLAHVILAEGLWSREFVGDFVDGENLFVAGTEVSEESFAEIHTHGVVRWWNLELKDRTPEWASERTGIPAEQIRRVAIGFANAAPAAISWVSPGASMQARGGYAAMAAHALNGLVGSTDSKGGVVQKTKVPADSIPDFSAYQDDLAKKGSKMPKIDQRGTLEFPSLKKGKSGGGVVTNNAADAMLTEDPYDLKVVIAYWNNFPFSCSGGDRWERALEKLPFLAHVTTNASEMSHFADLILPAAHQLFEKWSFLKSKQNLHGYASLTQRMVEPLWDVRQDETEIPWMLAEKLADKGFDNLLRYYKESFSDPQTGASPGNGEEFTVSALKLLTRACWDESHSNYGKYGDKLEGWDDFVDKGVWNSHRYTYRTKWGKFKTKTGKFEFYSETLKAALEEHADKHDISVDEALAATNYTAEGEQAFVPHFEPPLRWGDEQEFPLIFFEHRSRLNREGRSANCTWYHAHKNCDPGDENWDDVLKMNPFDAQKLGLNDRESVRVISQTGEMTVTLKLWEGVRPGTVAKCFGQGHWAYGRIAARDFHNRIARGGSNNDVLPPEYDRLSGSTARHGGPARVRVIRA